MAGAVRMLSGMGRSARFNSLASLSYALWLPIRVWEAIEVYYGVGRLADAARRERVGLGIDMHGVFGPRPVLPLRGAIYSHAVGG